MKRNSYSLDEVIEMLKGKAEQQPPFWGETTLVWQNNKIVLWKETSSKKPNGTTEGKKVARVDKTTD